MNKRNAILAVMLLAVSVVLFVLAAADGILPAQPTQIIALTMLVLGVIATCKIFPTPGLKSNKQL